MTEGFSDIFKGLCGVHSGKFSWSEWGVQKVMSVATQLLLNYTTKLYYTHTDPFFGGFKYSSSFSENIFASFEGFKKSPSSTLSVLKNMMKTLTGKDYTWHYY